MLKIDMFVVCFFLKTTWESEAQGIFYRKLEEIFFMGVNELGNISIRY